MITSESYPIGQFDWNAEWTAASRYAAIGDITGLPTSVRLAVDDLRDAQLDTSYRQDGWTVRQVAHHVTDSYIHGYIRLKSALAEDHPTIAPYDQAAWAELSDSHLPLAPSLAILDGLAERWVVLCRGLDDRQLARVYIHKALGPVTVDAHLHFFAWHFRHHIAQIVGLRRRQGW